MGSRRRPTTSIALGKRASQGRLVELPGSFPAGGPHSPIPRSPSTDTDCRLEAAMSNEYAFRVRGRLSPDVIAALDPLRPVDSGRETILRGVVTDQAALHGIIARFEQFGVELVELTRLPGTLEQPREGTSPIDIDATTGLLPRRHRPRLSK
jgi:hypothetical protein